MSFDQLESFVAIAEEGALVRAARRLCITQPPLTRRIQGLESELGTALFERLPRGMRLTPAGQRLLPYARQVLQTVQAATEAVGGKGEGEVGARPLHPLDAARGG